MYVPSCGNRLWASLNKGLRPNYVAHNNHVSRQRSCIVLLLIYFGMANLGFENPAAAITIDGVWNTTTVTDESALFWQHVRLAGLAAGPTSTGDAAYFPTNADGGRMGIESGSAATGGLGIGRSNEHGSRPLGLLGAVRPLLSRGNL